MIDMLNALNLIGQSDEWANVPEAPTYIDGTYWFPVQASSFANKIDFMFYAIFWVSLFFFVGIVGAMLYFVIKYRRRPGRQVEKSPSHNTVLEIAWSVLPGFLLIWFFIEGANGYFAQRVSPGDVEQIHVVARQFNWQFIYPNGDMTSDLHLVRNRPTEFVMESRDVLHAWYVPAFRQKQDIVPGRYTKTWVKPTRSGMFRLYCAEYCGDGHSMMKTNVTVHETVESRDAATRWLWDQEPPVKNGERLFNMQCSGCHNSTEQKKTGPGLANIWGKQEQMDDGSTIVVDENYFRESLLNPNAKIVAGYARPSQMNSFQGKLNDDQIFWLMTYVKSLSGVVDEPTPEPGVEGGAVDDAQAADAAAESDGQIQQDNN